MGPTPCFGWCLFFFIVSSCSPEEVQPPCGKPHSIQFWPLAEVGGRRLAFEIWNWIGNMKKCTLGADLVSRRRWHGEVVNAIPCPGGEVTEYQIRTLMLHLWR